VAHRIGQAQSRGKIGADAEHFQLREVALELGQRMPQEVHEMSTATYWPA